MLHALRYGCVICYNNNINDIAASACSHEVAHRSLCAAADARKENAPNYLCLLLIWSVVWLVTVAPASGDTTGPVRHVARVRALLSELRGESVSHAARLRRAYRSEVPALAFSERRALETAYERGVLAHVNPLTAYNVRFRTVGTHPIAELDLDHQSLYLGARLETLGCLFDVASRLRLSDVEVTSLVRHARYQHRLTATNGNARTAVPTHVMGLAFDLSVLHMPLEAVQELRDVLRDMAAHGDLLFIAERRQLVFHVVPAPSRRAYYRAFAASLEVSGDSQRLYPARAMTETSVSVTSPAWSATASRRADDLGVPPTGGVVAALLHARAVAARLPDAGSLTIAMSLTAIALWRLSSNPMSSPPADASA